MNDKLTPTTSILKKRTSFNAIINDKPVVFQLPYTEEELINELNYQCEANVNSFEEIKKWINDSFEDKGLKEVKYLFTKLLLDWKKANVDNPTALAPNASKQNIKVQPELHFTSEDDYEEYINE